MKKLSPAQIAMLKSGEETGNLYSHLSGRSELGGAVWTVRALRKLGYINQDWHVTHEGRAALVHALQQGNSQ